MPTRVRPLHRTRSRPARALAAAIALTFLLAAPVATAADRGVRIQDFAFAPRTLTITVGDRVRWTNRDAIEHTASARNGSFDTGLLGQGESATIRFTTAGTYRYLCTPHPTMTGTIVVRAAGSAPPDTASPTVTDAPEEGVPPAWAGVLVLVVLLALAVRRPADRRAPSATEAGHPSRR